MVCRLDFLPAGIDVGLTFWAIYFAIHFKMISRLFHKEM